MLKKLKRYRSNNYDTDGDGVNDRIDAFPLDPEHNSDQDGDGIPIYWIRMTTTTGCLIEQTSSLTIQQRVRI